MLPEEPRVKIAVWAYLALRHNNCEQILSRVTPNLAEHLVTPLGTVPGWLQRSCRWVPLGEEFQRVRHLTLSSLKKLTKDETDTKRQQACGM